MRYKKNKKNYKNNLWAVYEEGAGVYYTGCADAFWGLETRDRES